ncbi:AraC family transcriptional regulator [Paenibacillus sp. GCM10027626]|uniref:AraC family transcriptional regulator n=1 Tax=Paenibacillus sp. GCM10027626 TaxID=3273411 RepID=UPI0036429CC1
MTFPAMMHHGALSDPFYVEYARQTEPYSMVYNHFHPYYELYYLLSGARVYFIKDTTYPVQVGDLVFIRKNEVHKTIQAGPPAHERILFYIDDRYIRDWPEPLAKLLLSPFREGQPVVRLPEEARAQVAAHMSRLLSELHNQPAGCELFFRQAFNDILLQCARFLQTNQPEETVHQHVSPVYKKVTEVARYLNSHYNEQIQLQDLSKQFYVSPYYLSRLFKEVTGFTVIDYLNLARVKEAQRLLRETSLKITDIAAMTGFGNFSHFGKTFKKISRVSAREYRQGKLG